MNDLLSRLQWRYATKRFDPTKDLSAEQVHTLEEALRLAPSSRGLQPWGFVEVTDPALRKTLREEGSGQPQMTDADRLFVLCVRTDLNADYVDRFIASTAEAQQVPVSALKTFEDSLKRSLATQPAAQTLEWAKRQVYIALGFVLEAAAVIGVDACPMEGFDPAAFDRILKLADRHLTSLVCVAVGFRAEGDEAAARPKSRFSRAEVFVEHPMS